MEKQGKVHMSSLQKHPPHVIDGRSYMTVKGDEMPFALVCDGIHSKGGFQKSENMLEESSGGV